MIMSLKDHLMNQRICFKNMILFCLTFQISIKWLNIKEIVCLPLNIMKRSKPQKVS